MWSTCNAVASGSSHAIRASVLAKNPRSALISVTARARSTAIMVSTSAIVASSITPGQADGLWRGPVEDVSLEYFAHGRAIRVRHHRPRFDRREVVYGTFAPRRTQLSHPDEQLRALSGQLVINGAGRSTQVERLLSGARRFACAFCSALWASPPEHQPLRILRASSTRAVGEGPTTIVLVAGLGDTQDVWADVQPLIAANCARTFAYTPAGYERSAPASRAVRRRYSRLRAARLQLEIAADFPAAAHVRVEESGHYIQLDRPEVVINSARELAGCSRATEPAWLRTARLRVRLPTRTV